MPILTLKFKENTVAEHPLAKGGSLTIGRLEDNDVAIENLAVSGHHAKIDSVGDGFLLTDLKSRNGSFVNGEMVNAHWLQNGDAITIGKHTLIFSYNKGEQIPDPTTKPMNQTMILDTDNYRDMLAKVSKVQGRPKSAEQEKPIGVLTFLSGGSGESELNKKLVKIGKAPSSDIVISGFTVGKTAVTISKRPNGYVLSYVSGISKPKVKGITVKESVLLEEFDIIEIGSAKIQFIYKN